MFIPLTFFVLDILKRSFYNEPCVYNTGSSVRVPQLSGFFFITTMPPPPSAAPQLDIQAANTLSNISKGGLSWISTSPETVDRPSSLMPSSLSKRHVAFDLNATRFHVVEQAKDMTAAEVEATWYSRSELAFIRSQNDVSANFMKVGVKRPELRGHCFRGLEFKHDTQGIRRKQIMVKSLAAVFAQQRRQIAEHNVVDPVELASVYSRYSCQCTGQVLRMGKIDEAAAMCIHQGRQSYYEPEFGQQESDSTYDSYYSVDLTIDDNQISELFYNDKLAIDSEFSGRRFMIHLKALLRRKVV